MPLVPLTLDFQPNALAPQAAPVPPSETVPELFPVTEATVPGDPDLQDEMLFSRRPHANRIHRSGQVDFRPLSLEDIRERGPEFDRETPGGDRPGFPDSPTASPYQRRRIPTLVWVTAASVAVLLVLTAFIGMGRLSNAASRKQAKSSVSLAPLAGIEKKLNLSARETLTTILTSTDPEVIANHVIGGEAMLPAIRERLSADDAFPSLSEADLVSPVPMNEADLRRGLAGLFYQAAPQNIFRLDRPLLPASMQNGVAGFSLLEAGAVIARDSAPLPDQALALFASEKGKALLDWELFVQTLDRRLDSFSSGNLGEGPLRFRVILSLDKAVFENGEFIDDVVVRIQDPIHLQDILRVSTGSSDPVVVALREISSSTDEDPTAAMKPRTATVDLRLMPASGRLVIENFVCWEFIGLGNATPLVP